MEWFKNTFLKSILENPKMKDITIPEKEKMRKTCCISEKQFDICKRYMEHVKNIAYSGYNGSHLEFFANGINYYVIQQPKGYAILTAYIL